MELTTQHTYSISSTLKCECKSLELYSVHRQILKECAPGCRCMKCPPAGNILQVNHDCKILYFVHAGEKERHTVYTEITQNTVGYNPSPVYILLCSTYFSYCASPLHHHDLQELELPLLPMFPFLPSVFSYFHISSWMSHNGPNIAEIHQPVTSSSLSLIFPVSIHLS